MRRRPLTRRAAATRLHRRAFLKAAAAGLALPGTLGLLGGEARAQGGRARRLIVFYYPDGVPGWSQEGDASLWHIADDRETGYALPDLLAPLRPWQERLMFFRGLSMGPTDNGSHPGGAMKLLTGMDGGRGMSLDRVLAQGVGADAPHRHVYLGVQANHNGASGDKHISYPRAGASSPPDDDPVRAFQRLFGGGLPIDAPPAQVDARSVLRRSVLDVMQADLRALRSQVSGRERARLDLHLDAVREVEGRLGGLPEPEPPAQQGDACERVPGSVGAVDQGNLYAPEQFPALVRAQTDTLVTAMACGLTRVGVLQCAHHTTDLLMSAFPQTEMADFGIYMRSHEASHYGARHDFNDAKFASYVAQRRWFYEQFAYLLDQLAARPEGDGTMLDHTVVLLCTEVCDGNTHQHDDMPFAVAGGEAGGVRTGRQLRFGYRRHGDLLAAIGQSLGADFPRFGDAGEGALPGFRG